MNTDPKRHLCGRRYWVTLFSAPPGFSGRCAAGIEAKREQRLAQDCHSIERAAIAASGSFHRMSEAFAALGKRGSR
jgi:hypothetical protein